MKSNRKILIIALIVSLFATIGCATTQMADQSVSDMATVSADFDRVMVEFAKNWPYISGAIDGAYEGRTFAIPNGHIELKEAIDTIIIGLNDDIDKLTKYDKGKMATLWASLVTSELIRWIKEFKPDILQLIPVALINF